MSRKPYIPPAITDDNPLGIDTTPERIDRATAGQIIRCLSWIGSRAGGRCISASETAQWMTWARVDGLTGHLTTLLEPSLEGQIEGGIDPDDDASLAEVVAQVRALVEDAESTGSGVEFLQVAIAFTDLEQAIRDARALDA